MRAQIVIKPKKAKAGESLRKRVSLDDEQLPDVGQSFRVHELGYDIVVTKIVTGESGPEIHLAQTLSATESHKLKSQGWEKL